MILHQEIPVKEKISSYDFLKIETFDVNKRYTKPHKHKKYLEIVFFTKGSGFHYLDSKPLEIKPPIVFLINKDQVHHWCIDSFPEGYVIIIKESFLENILDNAISFQLNTIKDLMEINVAKNDEIVPLLFEALRLEMKQSQVNSEVIESGLKALLSKLMSYSRHQISANNKGIDYKFMQLLSKSLKNSVAYYSRQLHTSSQNLNAICQKSFNKKASDVIAEFIIKEVKRQLLYTTKNVSDIAFDLEFKDTSNFTKFYKKHTNLTPLQFKKGIE